MSGSLFYPTVDGHCVEVSQVDDSPTAQSLFTDRVYVGEIVGEPIGRAKKDSLKKDDTY
jgi:hypothetical protein